MNELTKDKMHKDYRSGEGLFESKDVILAVEEVIRITEEWIKLYETFPNSEIKSLLILENKAFIGRMKDCFPIIGDKLKEQLMKLHKLELKKQERE